MTNAAVTRRLPKRKGIAAFAVRVNNELNGHWGAVGRRWGELCKPKDSGALAQAVWPRNTSVGEEDGAADS